MSKHLFFGSVTAFSVKFEVLTEPWEVIIDFVESRVMNLPAKEALNKITKSYHKVGKKVHLRHLSPDCKKLLAKADEIIDINLIEDPTYKLVIDELTKNPNLTNHKELIFSFRCCP